MRAAFLIWRATPKLCAPALLEPAQRRSQTAQSQQPAHLDEGWFRYRTRRRRIQIETADKLEIRAVATDHPAIDGGVIDVELVIEGHDEAVDGSPVRVAADLRPAAEDIDEHMVVGDPARQREQVLQLNVAIARNVDHDVVTGRAGDRQRTA